MSLGGGILGALIGGFFGGGWGAVIGGCIGASLTSKNEAEPGSGGGATGNPQEQANENLGEFYIRLFRCLGKLAKADGHVCEDEAAFVREMMKNEIPPADRKRYAAEFNAGRDSLKSFSELVHELKPCLNPQGGEICIQIFCAMVAADHVVSPGERQMLLEAGSILNAEEEVRKFFRDTTGGPRNAGTGSSSGSGYSSSSGPQERSSAPQNLSAAYELLGVKPDVTDKELKKAYHKKVSECHPDHVQGAGLSEVFINFAKEQIQQINNAYEMICKSRGIS